MTAANNKGKVHREFPRTKEKASGKASTPEISIPFHHHCAHGRWK